MKNEKPIIFSAPMVRAILDGHKTQTRRVIKPCFGDGSRETPLRMDLIKCPYGKPGDRLWVRETWATCRQLDDMKPSELDKFEPVFYAATNDVRIHGAYPVGIGRKRPLIYMPRWASRITLEITDIRVERVQDIGDEDAVAEGLNIFNEDGANLYYSATSPIDEWPDGWFIDPRDAFSKLWDSINAERGHGWDANPWVWVIEFERVDENA